MDMPFCLFVKKKKRQRKVAWKTESIGKRSKNRRDGLPWWNHCLYNVPERKQQLKSKFTKGSMPVFTDEARRVVSVQVTSILVVLDEAIHIHACQ
ncbi:hypothetical protein L1049_000428 [Liquidambar formosana]|uniref:Uncharacterized protein n=1 Tax=Liquidambar formosana TaxID=63359 RepID=A0AAP0NCR3_LIQFO